MDLRQLSYVVAVVDEGGFTAAADRIGITQPSLSQAVRSLESELGVRLFHRTGRSVVLTAAGEALLEPARLTLRDAETARAAVEAVAGLSAGRLDLVCLPTLAVEPVAGLIGRFRQSHPDVAVRLLDPPEARSLPGLVRDGTAEIGVTHLPLAATDLATRPLQQHDYVAVVPPHTEDRFGSARSVSLRVLASYPLITTPEGTATRGVIDDAFASEGLEATVAVETAHRETIGPLVIAGAGVSILPRPVAEDAARRGATIRTIHPKVRRAIGVIHRKGPLSPAAAAFLELTR
ncbi:MAG: LysR family transcriptional regulator [Actinobacteria bacterium]|nr:LysR family transcriptional regulator [Actinomycetota bacterium]